MQEIKVIFALAEFLKYQSLNEEETVSMFDMAQKIFDNYRQQRAKQARRFLMRYMSRQEDLLLGKVHNYFDLWQARCH